MPTLLPAWLTTHNAPCHVSRGQLVSREKRTRNTNRKINREAPTPILKTPEATDNCVTRSTINCPSASHMGYPDLHKGRAVNASRGHPEQGQGHTARVTAEVPEHGQQLHLAPALQPALAGLLLTHPEGLGPLILIPPAAPKLIFPLCLCSRSNTTSRPLLHYGWRGRDLSNSLKEETPDSSRQLWIPQLARISGLLTANLQTHLGREEVKAKH